MSYLVAGAPGYPVSANQVLPDIWHPGIRQIFHPAQHYRSFSFIED